MARPKKNTTTHTKTVVKTTRKTAEPKAADPSFLENVRQELNLNQSYLSLVLGLLIVLVAGVLVFSFFKGRSGNLIPAQQATGGESQTADADPNNLPGKYTVKEGDTLYSIAQKYYQDGYKFSELVKANQLTDENILTVGQVLEVPKLETQTAAQDQAAPSPSLAPAAPTTPEAPEAPAETVAANNNQLSGTGTGGAENQTIWGEKITGDSYTIVEGDWLSTIAGRAYGDIMQYKKLAEVNNIQNPDLITPGMQIKLPR